MLLALSLNTMNDLTRICFIGNPNVGKSSWINELFKTSLIVGNWAGVTIQKKEIIIKGKYTEYIITDLPGIYSLYNSENEEEECIKYLTNFNVDLIVNVVDATNLSRNLRLTLMLKKLGIPMIVLLSFVKETKALTDRFDLNMLARNLELVIFADKYNQSDLTKIRNIFEQVASNNSVNNKNISYTNSDNLCNNISYNIQENYKIKDIVGKQGINETLRYRNSNRIDKVLLNKFFGLPMLICGFGFIILTIFQLSKPITEMILALNEEVLRPCVALIISGLPESLKDYILNTSISGVGGVLSFFPLIYVFHLVNNFLEESGYMARIAFMFDRIMQIFKLNGKSIIVFMIGFGCNVPAINATRIIGGTQQKRLAALLIPFMSCSARLPVYALFSSAFFAKDAAIVIVTMYGIGLLFAFIIALVLSKVKYFKTSGVTIIELPPYRLPKIAKLIKKANLEIVEYLKKVMVTVFVALSILWCFSYLPNGNRETSYLARSAKYVSIIFKPLGFGENWECVAALPSGMIAKEAIVGYFQQIQNEKQYSNIAINRINILNKTKLILHETIQKYSTHYNDNNKPSYNHKINNLFSGKAAKAKAFSYLVYILLSIPCIMSLQAIYNLYGKKLLFYSVITMIITPYVASLIIYQLLVLVCY